MSYCGTVREEHRAGEMLRAQLRTGPLREGEGGGGEKMRMEKVE